MTKKTLTLEEVAHLGKLVQLKLDEKEIKKYQKQLSQTLDYAANLDEISEDEVGLEVSQENPGVFFDDRISKERLLTADQALANAKTKKDQYFSVEQIL